MGAYHRAQKPLTNHGLPIHQGKRVILVVRRVVTPATDEESDSTGNTLHEVWEQLCARASENGQEI